MSFLHNRPGDFRTDETDPLVTLSQKVFGELARTEPILSTNTDSKLCYDWLSNRTNGNPRRPSWSAYIERILR